MRYAIKLSYCGRDFCGWQIQPSSPSIQQTVQDALSTLLRAEIPLTGAGRTDSGVNAVGYVAHFDVPFELDTAGICYKLNAILPKSITVHSIIRTDDNFHARFDATKREYTYFLHRVKDPFIENTSFFYPYPLDFESMNKAASFLYGTHDFSCFEKNGGDNKTSICTVTEARWQRYTPARVQMMSGNEYRDGDYWYFRIAADRFLRNMVRAIVGTLIDVGRGKRGVEEFSGLIGGGTRSQAGESVPGNALFLSGIEY